MRLDFAGKFISWVFVGVLLVACGGGGGGGDDSGSGGGGGGAQNVAPTAEAGQSKTVTPGDTVELVAGGSDGDGEIAERSWNQLSGPSVSLTAIELDSAHFSFVVPVVSELTEMEFRLTVTDDDGASASDTVIFTVLPMPVASAGPDRTVDRGADVLLEGSVSPDAGDIEYTFSWKQISGESVTLESADQAETIFTAPDTQVILMLAFELTVTNEAGASDSDTVTIEVAHPDAPELELAFPPPSGAYLGAEISVFGKVEAVGCETWVLNPDGTVYCETPATIESVSVDAGLESVSATIESDGSWRADNVNVPDGVSEFTITVEAIDSTGRNRLAQSVLLTDDSAVGEGDSWKESVAVAVEPDAGLAYVLTTGAFVSDVGVVPVELETGDRGESITDFSDESQGPTRSVHNDMVYDRENGYFYLTDVGFGGAAVVSVERDSGQRALVSEGDDSSQGEMMSVPVGLTLGPDGWLYVADNGGDDGGVPAVLQVAIEDGQRTVLANASTATDGVGTPLHLAWDGTHRLWLTQNTITPASILEFDLSVNPVTSDVLTDGSDIPELTAWSQGIVFDADGNRLFVMNGTFDNIVAVNASNGEHGLVAENVTGSSSTKYVNPKGIAFESASRLLYVVGDDALFVIDPESGDKVVLSR